jgi:hypothetical protein
MRTVCIALLAVTGLFAQNQTGFVNSSGATRSFGSVVNPGGSGPGVVRTTGSILLPGGGSPQIAVPPPAVRPAAGTNANRFGVRHNNGAYAYPVAVPVYVGSYDMLGGASMAPPPQQQQQQPNVIVIYPPAPPAYSYQQMPAQSNVVEVPPAQLQPEEQTEAKATQYLIAFKDHSIYSAVAYFVEGDTLHYFISGNTHNQAPVSNVDRELTKKLNEISGLEVKLPAR